MGRVDLVEAEAKGGENREPNRIEFAEGEEKRLCEECKQESSEGRLGDWGDFSGKWYCAQCWDAWGQWTCNESIKIINANRSRLESKSSRRNPSARNWDSLADNSIPDEYDPDVLERRQESRLKLRAEIAARARSRAKAEAVEEKVDPETAAQQMLDEEIAALRVAQRRRQLCKSPACNFCVHSDERVGPFCCFTCNKTNGQKHGERCQQRVIRTKVWPHERGAPPVYLTAENLEDEAARADPLEAARKEVEKVAASAPAQAVTGPPLLQAVAKGDLRKVMKLLRDGADPNVRDLSGESMLMQASKRGKADLVAVLLLRKANPFHLNSNGQTADDLAGDMSVKALLRLFRYERRDAATEQVALGGLSVSLRKEVAEHFQIENASEDVLHEDAADPAISIKLGEAPLIKAVREGELQAVWDMLSKGADPNVRDILGETPLFEAVASGRVDMVACLLLLGASPRLTAPNGQTAHSMANDSILRALLRVFEDERSATGSAVHMALDGMPTSSSLQLTIRQEIAQRFSTKEHLVEVQRVAAGFIAGKAERETSSLLEAVRAGDLERVLGLLSDGADPNIKDEVGETPLFEASAGVSSGSCDLAAALLLRQAEPSAVRQDGKTCLEIAATDSMRALLQLFSSSVAARDTKKVLGAALEGLLAFRNEVIEWYSINDSLLSSSLHLEASQETSNHIRKGGTKGRQRESVLARAVRDGKLESVLSLLQSGENPNESDFLGETPLFEAAASGSVDMVAALLVARADANLQSKTGQNALEMSENEAMADLIRLFEGSCPVLMQQTVLSNLSTATRSSVVQHLRLKPAPVEQHSNFSEVARALESGVAEKGEPSASVNRKLSNAVCCDDLESARAALQEGADPNSLGLGGDTQLFEAVTSCSLDMVALLLINGADPETPCASGLPEQHVCDSNYRTLLKLFQPGDIEPADIANMLRGIRDTSIYEVLRSDLDVIGFEHIIG